MKVKAMILAGVSSSPKRSTPSRKFSVGAMYWMNPIVESRSRRTPFAKQMRGNTVTKPDAMRRRLAERLTVMKCDWLLWARLRR